MGTLQTVSGVLTLKARRQTKHNIVMYVPGVPDYELVVPRGDEEVVRQHDQVARCLTRVRELKVGEDISII